ncbi:MAG: hypothetical protein ACRC2B_05995 [Rubrivivax sp.]
MEPDLGGEAIGKLRHGQLIAFALVLAITAPAMGQGPKPAPMPAAAAAAAAAAEMNVLKGAWVRPDGGYVIQIKGIGADGALDAMYFNPMPLPFALARASLDGAMLRVSLELRAGGYGGSTYELAYDSATDRLKGVYYQAVAKQRFEVAFARK